MRNGKRKGKKFPPPCEEVIQKIKKGKILFLSFYGAFTGKINEVYLPTSITKKFIKNKKNKLKDFKKIKNKKINFENILIGKIEGKISNHITTNKLFSKEKFEGEAKELIKIAKELSKNYTSIDMELGILISKLKEKFPIGAIGITSDVLDKENLHMKPEIIKNNWDFHTKKCFKAIKCLIE